ncbi:RsiV family protein [Mycolicibacterium sp. 120266]|uniref:RsiV family protein n=1 Tax=Mycolicibacterium sp. 120266 TaxID=3090601 RepID=UPI00299CD570|nr:RsiV family protein [Mycolicibacterium sp. 120266]MDX1872505.1 RsiV family protein [Mycolicibacterium sp. 120266]
MRFLSVAVAATVAAVFGSAGVAAAAPKDYCADLKGANTGRTCEIQLSDPGYSVDISIPLDFPDQKSVADYISQTRDTFLNTAKSGAARTTPYVLSMEPAEYSSSVPPRGTQAVVFSITQDIGSGPQRTYKSFNWDQTFRKEITYTAAPDDKQNTPLWRVDDPLKTVAPIVQSELQQQLAPPPAAPPTPTTSTTPTTTTTPTTATTSAPPPAPLPFSQAALYNPANYQNFAVVNDGVIFFFDQGVLLPASAGPLHVLVPRSQIDPMIA